ncbi:MAG: hypothetical protein ACRDEB_04935 [Chitinophagaceae bacterium]
MTQKRNILQELDELKSTLATFTPQNIYTVPVGYFDGLSIRILNRIKALETTNASEEISFLSATVSKVSKQLPYTIPSDYFNGLAERMMHSVRESSDYRNAKEELETLSPLLSGLKKITPYVVPQGYFDNLDEGRIQQQKTKVISIVRRTLFQYATAAVVTGFIVIAGFVLLKSRTSLDPVEQPYAWVKKNIKKVDKADIDAFVSLADEELINHTVVVNSPLKPGEIKELMKDISDREIQDFLDATPETEIDTETMMN